MPYRTLEQERIRDAKRRLTYKYKNYQRDYQRKWRLENNERAKEIRAKSEARPERREYCRNWQRTSLTYINIVLYKTSKAN